MRRYRNQHTQTAGRDRGTEPADDDPRRERLDRRVVVGQLAEDPVREIGRDEREAEQVERVRCAGALDRAPDDADRHGQQRARRRPQRPPAGS